MIIFRNFEHSSQPTLLKDKKKIGHATACDTVIICAALT